MEECTGPAVAHWLQEHKHEGFSVYEEPRGMSDANVMAKAFTENWIVIANDKKGFGEEVYRERRPHKGIVPLALK